MWGGGVDWGEGGVVEGWALVGGGGGMVVWGGLIVNVAEIECGVVVVALGGYLVGVTPWVWIVGCGGVFGSFAVADGVRLKISVIGWLGMYVFWLNGVFVMHLRMFGGFVDRGGVGSVVLGEVGGRRSWWLIAGLALLWMGVVVFVWRMVISTALLHGELGWGVWVLELAGAGSLVLVGLAAGWVGSNEDGGCGMAWVKFGLVGVGEGYGEGIREGRCRGRLRVFGCRDLVEGGCGRWGVACLGYGVLGFGVEETSGCCGLKVVEWVRLEGVCWLEMGHEFDGEWSVGVWGS
ncbi:hypothetical protein Tco_0777386 [Tanacetum coccineum]